MKVNFVKTRNRGQVNCFLTLKKDLMMALSPTMSFLELAK